MSSRTTNILDAIADTPAATAPARRAAVLVAVVLAGMAAFTGIATAVVGSVAGNRAIYYVAVLVLFVIGGLVTLTRKQPLRFAFLALVACFPILNAELPPGRFELSIFHGAMAALTIALLARYLTGSSARTAAFFPTKAYVLAFVLIVPCIAFSQYPLWSLQQFFFKNFSIFIFLLFALDELKGENGFERLVCLLSVVLLVMGAGLFVDHALHMNLSLRGSNFNQSTVSESGLKIYRAGGFFQDPQRAGGYLACMITFLLLLNIRGRFAGTKIRYLVWAAITVSLAALVTTISRSAILACLSVSAITLFLFNKWTAATKMLLAGGITAVAICIAMTPMETWLKILPSTVVDRFQNTNEEVDNRLNIWFDTWDMFTDHPIAGIGIASFRPYLIETRPGVTNYYDIGTTAGVTYIPDQPESGYLKILYEGGILGSLAALVIVFDAFRRAVVVIARKTTSPPARTEMIAALAALSTFGVTFITLYNLSDERIAALFAILLAVILHRSLQNEQTAQIT